MVRGFKKKIRRKLNIIRITCIILLLVIGGIVLYTETEYQKQGQNTQIKPDLSLLVKEKILNVSSYTNAGTCYYNSGTGLGSYLENISFDDFVWYGRPARFEYNSYLIGPPGRGLMLEAFNNLGYISFHGSTNKEFDPTSHYNYQISDDDVMFFDSGTDALDFIESLVDKGIPVIVKINEKPIIPRDHMAFKIFAGYDEKNVYLSWKPYLATRLEDYKTVGPLAYPKDKFLESWSVQGHIFVWFEKRGVRKSESYILEANKRDIQTAQGNIQKLVNSLEKGDLKIFNEDGTIKYSESGTVQMLNKFYEDGTLTRTIVSKKLKEYGYLEASKKYEAAAKLYQKKDYPLYKIFPSIASLERDAAMLLE